MNHIKNTFNWISTNILPPVGWAGISKSVIMVVKRREVYGHYDKHGGWFSRMTPITKSNNEINKEYKLVKPTKYKFYYE